MTLDNLLKDLLKVESRLYSADIQEFFEKQSVEIRNHFVSFRQEVAVLVGKLTNAQLTSIAQKLEELSDDLNAAISTLQSKSDELNSTIAILNALGVVLGLAARIAVLV